MKRREVAAIKDANGNPLVCWGKTPENKFGIFVLGEQFGEGASGHVICQAMNFFGLKPEEVVTRSRWNYRFEAGQWTYVPGLEPSPTVEELAKEWGITAADHDEARCLVCKKNRIPGHYAKPWVGSDERRCFEGALNPVNYQHDMVSHQLAYKQALAAA